MATIELALPHPKMSRMGADGTPGLVQRLNNLTSKIPMRKFMRAPLLALK